MLLQLLTREGRGFGCLRGRTRRSAPLIFSLCPEQRVNICTFMYVLCTFTHWAANWLWYLMYVMYVVYVLKTSSPGEFSSSLEAASQARSKSVRASALHRKKRVLPPPEPVPSREPRHPGVVFALEIASEPERQQNSEYDHPPAPGGASRRQEGGRIAHRDHPL